MDQTQVLIQQQIFIRILQRNVVSSCYGRRCEFTVWILVETRYRHGFLRFSSSMNDIHDLKGKLEKLTHCLVLIKSPLIVDAFFPLINSFARNFVKFASNETPELRFVLALEIIIIRRVGNECSRNREIFVLCREKPINGLDGFTKNHSKIVSYYCIQLLQRHEVGRRVTE